MRCLVSNLFLSDLKTIPNILSVGRVFLVIITLLLANFTDQLVLTLILGITAGVTDFFDGYLARKLNQETALGQCSTNIQTWSTKDSFSSIGLTPRWPISLIFGCIPRP